jgi:two-component system sensor histidine kinase PilS (NtrC family)
LAGFGLEPDQAASFGIIYIISSIFTNLMAFFLTALLTGYLAERIRRSEAALKEKIVDYEELERLNAIIVSTLDSGLITVNQDFRIRVINQAAAELTGIEPADAYDRPIQELLPEIESLPDILHEPVQEEIIGSTRDGAGRILSITTVPFADLAGNRSGAVIDFRDVTRIREMESQLNRADRLAAIGELSARIAHEVRNPLASISGSVQLIAQSGDIPESDRMLLQIVIREADRLNTLIGNFLQYARLMPPRRCWIPYRHLLSEVLPLIVNDPRFSNVTITDRSTADVWMLIDADQFKQVLWNLLLNAAEAMGSNGEIDLLITIPPPRTAKGQSISAGWELTIADRGPGITEECMKTIFEPFFTTKAGGSGLGLALCYRIVEAHGGTITIQPRDGGGACVTIRITQPGHPGED